MRIAWFTPFSQKSSIGRCSYLIAAELVRYADVHIWHPDTEDPRTRPSVGVYLRRIADFDSTAHAQYDILIYNFGNHLPFHQEIFEISRRFPGVCIVHDFVMHHFFADYYLHSGRSPQSYLQAIEGLYGEPGRARAEASLAGRQPHIWETDEVIDYPMFEMVVRGAYGVVAHSDFLLDRIRRTYGGPVGKLFLPHEVRGLGLKHDRSHLGIPNDRALVITVGHANPNKQIHRVIDALGRNPDLAARVLYVIVGPCDENYRRQLDEAIRRYQIEESVRFTGYADDETLHAYMRLADLGVNLRFPAFEGASGSVVEEMLHGKPIIVNDTGFFRELPDETVRRIAPGSEEEQLAPAIRDLLDNRERRDLLAASALRYAGEHFQAARYVRDLLIFLQEVRETKPLLELADRVAGEMNQMGLSSDMAIVDVVSECLHDLFAREDEKAESAP